MGAYSTKPTEVFGPYLVYESLGVGGMATVHRAAKRGIEGFHRVVALKRLLPHLAEDAAFVTSFVREAKLASMLQHSNVVQIYELGRVGGAYFIAMEYIEGFDVRKILRRARRDRRPVPVPVILSILIELCDALDYAHVRADDSTGEPLRIVHRDVSPSNLIVSPSGHLKVIDFGIARAKSRKLGQETGRVKGKLGYMSPEAVRAMPLDGRSDLFSAGIVAHELLALRPLFTAKTDYQTLQRIRRCEVKPPSLYNADCPEELDAVVQRALGKTPGDRFETAAEMREALYDVVHRRDLVANSADVARYLETLFTPEEPTMILQRRVAAPPTPATPSPFEPVIEDDATVVDASVGPGGFGPEVFLSPPELEPPPTITYRDATATPTPAPTGRPLAAGTAPPYPTYRHPTTSTTGRVVYDAASRSRTDRRSRHRAITLGAAGLVLTAAIAFGAYRLGRRAGAADAACARCCAETSAPSHRDSSGARK
jgi:serine/threonine protein kinase